MHWNYRVIEFVDPNGGPWRAIHEVHYSDDGKPSSYTETPAEVIAFSSDGQEWEGGLAWILNMMRAALDKPVLVETDFRPVPTGENDGSKD